MAADNQIVVDDRLLENGPVLCTPRSDDGSPYCGDIYIEERHENPQHSVISKNTCPEAEGEYVQIVPIIDEIDESRDSRGRM